VGPVVNGRTGEAMILEEKLAIRAHFFRQEKSFQDLFDIRSGDAVLTEFCIHECGGCGGCGASGSTNF
jgi:hypothetical protein